MGKFTCIILSLLCKTVSVTSPTHVLTLYLQQVFDSISSRVLMIIKTISSHRHFEGCCFQTAVLKPLVKKPNLNSIA